jgi:hypothetical protein
VTSIESGRANSKSLHVRAAISRSAPVASAVRRTLWRRSLRWIGSDKTYVINLKQPGAKIYRKADKESEIIGATPPDALQLTANFGTPGLNDDAFYWNVSVDGDTLLTGYAGYVHEHDVKG